MKHVIYILISLEFISLILSFVFGVACAESGSWLLAVVFLFGPFLYGRIVNLNRHLDWMEAYEKELVK